MQSARSRPCLRPVESIVVPDRRHGRVLVLRDTQGVTDSQAVLPPDLVPIVSRFSGRETCESIAAAVSEEMGRLVDTDSVVALADELERALFLEGATFERARDASHAAFRANPVRAATHAGGAYHQDADRLREYVEGECLAKATLAKKPSAKAKPKETMVALIAPHIDPWRGALGYGHAYGALSDSLAGNVDTFLVFGTSHAPMKEPFALCRKAFDTPFGAMPVDGAALDELATAARSAGFDPYADEFNHKREHSIEFQAVFLKHLLGRREARIVPILAGLGEHQANGTSPDSDATVARFFDALRELVHRSPGRVVVVAGADLAHVGPRFGDPEPWDRAARKDLERTDVASLALATERDANAFWEDVAKDLDTRRVCGLGPIYSLLRSLEGTATVGRTLHYEQTVDNDDGSIVSHAAVGFFG